MKLAIFSTIKDCYEPYLIEWFNYHNSLGVDAFIIYDNESKIPIKDTIKGLPYKSKIRLFRVEGYPIVPWAYTDVMKKIQNGEIEYFDRVAVIDDDEYIMCKGDLKTILKEYDGYSGLGLNWLMFGSSGHKKRVEGSILKNFTKHADPNNDINKHIKSIVDPMMVDFFPNPHFASYKRGFCVGVDKELISGPFSKKPNHYKIWLNHYFVKTEEDFRERISRGNCNGTRRTIDEFHNHEKICNECDKLKYNYE